jgi:hypothetical protein
VDNVDRYESPAYMGRRLPCRPDVGFGPHDPGRLSCGEIREDSSTGLSTGRALSSPVHILETVLIHVHIWGDEISEIFSRFWNCPQ